MDTFEVINHLETCDIANIFSYIPIIQMRLYRLNQGYENISIAAAVNHLNNIQWQINNMRCNGNENIQHQS